MAIDVRNAYYQYGEIEALRGVSFTIERGAKAVLMGPNGAGKSTLISLLNGLEQPSRGEVTVLGEKLTRESGVRLRQRVGVVYQDPDDQIFSTTVEEDVAFGPRNLGLSEAEVEERVHTALGSVGMRELRKRSPFELSYGQKRRVAIAGVLAMRPEIIILDEPMAFLDPKSRDDLHALLETMHLMGMTLVVATHDVDFAAEWADQVLILGDGRMLASGTTDLLFDDRLLAEADLHLPRLARPFRLLQGAGDLRPRTVRQAAQLIWKLMVRGPRHEAEETAEHGAAERRERF
jgi:cobalt transport protein ATP-binding subunit